MKLARRMEGIGTETAFEAAARARALEAEGRSVIHLEIGEPDFDTPANIIAAAHGALDSGWTHYVPPLGIPALREAIAADARLRKGFAAEAANVVVTPGAKPIMFYALLALIDSGDEVIYPDPGFPIYESMTRVAGGTPRPYALREENDFRIDLDELRSLVSPRTKLIIFNSPHNPTGGVLKREDIEAIAHIARERDILVMADEIYARDLYEGEHLSIASLPDMAERTIVLDGFSKTFAMTGWRLGFGVLPEPLVEPVTRLVVNSVSCTAAFSQHAAIAALEGPWAPVEAMVASLRERRDLVVAGLNAVDGITCQEPAGAFYAFPRVAELGLPAAELADRLLEDAGVALLPGTAFGGHGEGYLRLSYATAAERLREGLDRIGWVAAGLRDG
jgi:aspartate/methionine/tyrosine aminotransferase